MAALRIDPTRVRGYRWFLNLAVMLCAAPIYWYAFSIGLLLPEMRTDLGLRPAQEGWLSAAFFLGSFVFTIPLTNLLSRLAPVRLMSGVFALCTALFFLAAAVPSYPVQVAVRFLVAVLFVANNPVRTLIIHQWFEPDEYPLANGASNATFGVTEPIAFFTTLPLLRLFGGWQGMIVFFGAFSAVSTAIWLALARDRPRQQRRLAAPTAGGGSPLGVLRRREVLYMGLIAAGGAMTWASFITFWPTVAENTFRLSDGMIGLVLAFTAIAVVPASLAAPMLLARTGRRVPLMAGAALLQAPAFALTLVTSNVPLLCLIGLFQGMSWLYFPLLLTAPFQLRRAAPREIAVAAAFIVVTNAGAQTLGPAIAGGLAEVFPLRPVLAIIALGPLVTALGALLIGEPEPEAEAAPGPS